MMDLFGDKDDEKKPGIKLENDDLFEIAAMLFKIQTKAVPDAFNMLNNPSALVEEYMKIVRALRQTLKNEKNY